MDLNTQWIWIHISRTTQITIWWFQGFVFLTCRYKFKLLCVPNWAVIIHNDMQEEWTFLNLKAWNILINRLSLYELIALILIFSNCAFKWEINYILTIRSALKYLIRVAFSTFLIFTPNLYKRRLNDADL